MHTVVWSMDDPQGLVREAVHNRLSAAEADLRGRKWYPSKKDKPARLDQQGKSPKILRALHQKRRKYINRIFRNA